MKLLRKLFPMGIHDQRGGVTDIMMDILLLVIIAGVAITVYVTMLIPQFNSWLGADSAASGIISLVKLGFGISVALGFIVVAIKGFYDIKK